MGTIASYIIRGLLDKPAAYWETKYYVDTYISNNEQYLVIVYNISPDNDQIDDKTKELFSNNIVRPVLDGKYGIIIELHDYQEDIKIIMKGKYSKISDIGKINILASRKSQNVKKWLDNIINPTELSRKQLADFLDDEIKPDAEVFSIINKSYEGINI